MKCKNCGCEIEAYWTKCINCNCDLKKTDNSISNTYIYIFNIWWNFAELHNTS